MNLIVRSKRPVLIIKALIIFAMALLIGWAVEVLRHRGVGYRAQGGRPQPETLILRLTKQ